MECVPDVDYKQGITQYLSTASLIYSFEEGLAGIGLIIRIATLGLIIVNPFAAGGPNGLIVTPVPQPLWAQPNRRN